MDNGGTTMNTTTIMNNSTAGGDTTMVVTSWTPIWVTLLICSLQGILCYSFFLYRRHSDRTHYQMVMTSTGHQDTKDDDDHNENEEQESTTTAAATAALQHCQLYESRQYTRSHRSPTPFELPSSSSSTNHPPTTSWWKSTWSMTHEALLQCVGLDTYMFLRVLFMGTRITGWGTLLSLILLPIYATGDERGMATEQFNLLTMARVEADGSSWRLLLWCLCWHSRG